MRTASIARLASLVLFASLGACASESDPVGFKVQAMSFANSGWSEPVNLGAVVNSNLADNGPALSKDGLSLYFASNRRGGVGEFDLWVSRRACGDCAWGTPVNLGSVINSAAVENRPALSADGHLLFFHSGRDGGHGDNDIWVSRRSDPNDDFGWSAPVNLGPDVNTETAEQAPFYLQSAEDGPDNLYFARGRPTFGEQDIYVAAVTKDGETRGPAVIVAELSVPSFNDAGATVRADGREIFFQSSRPGALGINDLYTSTRRSVHDPWSPPVNLGMPMNSTGADQQSNLSHDGRTLVWASNRPGSLLNPSGVPSFDLWMSTRTPSGH
jgi:hypothetical protein